MQRLLIADHQADHVRHREPLSEPEIGHHCGPQRRDDIDHRGDAGLQRQLGEGEQAERRGRVEQAADQQRSGMAAQRARQFGRAGACQREHQQEQCAEADAQHHQRGHADADEQENEAPQKAASRISSERWRVDVADSGRGAGCRGMVASRRPPMLQERMKWQKDGDRSEELPRRTWRCGRPVGSMARRGALTRRPGDAGGRTKGARRSGRRTIRRRAAARPRSIGKREQLSRVRDAQRWPCQPPQRPLWPQ